MTMVGVIPALVNSNLRQQSLLHTITVAKARAVVFSSELTSGEYSQQSIGLDHFTPHGAIAAILHTYIDPGFSNNHHTTVSDGVVCENLFCRSNGPARRALPT